MLLKDSIITSDTREKSLQHLTNISYNSNGYIKYKSIVSAFETEVRKTSRLFDVSTNTLKKIEGGGKINQDIDITKVLSSKGIKTLLNDTTIKSF